jgi:tetratricopeptide (TPR) repeat protein
MLAYHWELAGVPEKAFEWHRRAAAIGELNDARAAAEHWLKVLSHFETLEPTDEIMSIAAQAYGRLNAIGWRIGGTSEEDAKRRYEEGKALAQRIGDRRLLTMLTGSYSIQRGVNLGFANDYARLAQGSVAMADELDDPELQCAMRMWMVAGYLHSGRLREAIQCARETVTRIPEDLPFGSQYVGFPLRPGILLTQGLAHALAGEAAVAKDVWRRSRSEGQEVADVRIVTNGMESVTDGLYGATESASVLGEAAVSEADAMGTDYALVMGLWGLARAHAGAGRLADAEETCVRALELMESRNTGRMHLGGLAAVLAEVELRQGRPGQALTRARDTVDFCRLRGAYVDLSPWLVLAQAHTANGDRDGALTALDETQQLVRQTDARIFHPFLHERRAEFAEAFDADWSAEDERREAHRLFVELGAIGHSIRLEKNFAV